MSNPGLSGADGGVQEIPVRQAVLPPVALVDILPLIPKHGPRVVMTVDEAHAFFANNAIWDDVSVEDEDEEVLYRGRSMTFDDLRITFAREGVPGAMDLMEPDLLDLCRHDVHLQYWVKGGDVYYRDDSPHRHADQKGRWARAPFDFCALAKGWLEHHTIALSRADLNAQLPQASMDGRTPPARLLRL